MHQQRRNRLRAALTVSALAALAASCARTPPPPAAPPVAPRVEEPLSCRERLRMLDIEFEDVSDFGEGSCAVHDAVKVSRIGHAKLSSPAILTCRMAERLSEWEAVFVQPEAKRTLGSPVAVIHHYGAYACRRTNGTSRMSEHAHANAIDIGVFETEKGEKVSVTLHWSARDKRGEFLKSVGQGACTEFNGVLGPDSNRDHRDHFHFDMGKYAFCRLNPVDPRKVSQ